MDLENKYRMYMQLQRQKHTKNVLGSEEELVERLLALKPGEMLSISVLEREDADGGR